MADLLIRDISPSTKRLLKERAARHGTSQQREARAILEASLNEEPLSWVSRLRSAAQAVGGIDLPEPERHPARVIDTGGWA